MTLHPHIVRFLSNRAKELQRAKQKTEEIDLEERLHEDFTELLKAAALSEKPAVPDVIRVYDTMMAFYEDFNEVHLMDKKEYHKSLLDHIFKKYVK